MRDTLQNQYQAINEGKGNKDYFLKQARHLFPNYITPSTDYKGAVNILKGKSILSENKTSIVNPNYFNLFKNNMVKLNEEKKESTKKDSKNINDLNIQELLKGFYAEMGDEKNKDKSVDELKAIVVKNLSKDVCYYTKDGMFGVKGIGYKEPDKQIEPKGKHKGSGYGDLKEGTISLMALLSENQEKYVVKYSKSNNTHQVWKGEELITDFATKERADSYAKNKNDLNGLNESYMGKEGDEVVMEKTKHPFEGGGNIYHLTHASNYSKIDMTFDSKEEAEKYANKKGLKIVDTFADGDKPKLDEGKKQQSLPDGTKVKFDLKDISPEEFADEDTEEVKAYNGKVATIEGLETYTELGDKDYEYYDIKFDDGEMMYAVSGYHLDPVEDLKENSEEINPKIYNNRMSKDEKSSYGKTLKDSLAKLKLKLSPEGWEIIKKFIEGHNEGGYNRPEIIINLANSDKTPISKSSLASYSNKILYGLIDTSDLLLDPETKKYMLAHSMTESTSILSLYKSIK